MARPRASKPQQARTEPTPLSAAEDLRRRREIFLDAMTDTLVRLRLRELMAERAAAGGDAAARTSGGVARQPRGSVDRRDEPTG
jgi:hypothetical protein